MKIQIIAERKGAKPVVVDVPDDITDGAPFHVDVDGRKYVARWSQRASSLVISPVTDPAREPSDNPAEYSIPVRLMRTTRFPGESEATCDIECVLPAGSGPGRATTLRSSAQRFIPGLGHTAGGPGGRPAKGMRNPVLRSQITGKVLNIQVAEGAIVDEGAPLLVIEAMKMENRIVAPAKVRIATIKVKQGANVSAGDELMRFEAAEA